MSSPLVSIVLVTRDGRDTLPAVLDAIDGQKATFPFETIAVDSGSVDGSDEILRGRVDRMIAIPPESFDHGETRNLGIREARGELVVLLVQDAVPASEDWLARLVEPLRSDPTLAGTWARQVPRPSASAVTRHYLARWMGSSLEPRVSALGGREELAALAPAERLARCTFDNVCSCVRRSVWQDIPFRATPIAEDVAWAREVLLAGHKLAYVPEAAVVHSHDRSIGYELRRTYAIHRELRRLFGLRLVPSPFHLARAIAGSLAVHAACVLRGGVAAPAELFRALGLAFVFPLGQYLGAQSSRDGVCVSAAAQRASRLPLGPGA